MMRENWIEATLGEVCNINMGQSPPSSTYNTEKIGLPFFQGKAEFTTLHPVVIKWCSEPKKIANENDILLSVRAPVGTTNVANQKCAIGRGLAAISYSRNYKYILYYLKLIERKLDSQGTGTTFKAISGNILKSQTIPIPPLPEQRAIVAKIEQLFSELDNGVANLKAAKDKLEIFRQAVLQKAFEGELTKEWRTKNYCDQSDFLKSLINDKNEAISKNLIKKDNYFPGLTKERLIYNPPDNWLQLPWKTICRNNKYAMKRGPFGSALKKAFFVDSGYTVYEQGHAINDDPYRDRYFISEERYQDLKAFRVKPGDMIISCSGVTLGRICLLPDDCNSGIINQALLKIDLDERVILKKFFLIMFRSEAFQRKIFQKSLGTAMPNMVSMTELKELLIPVPSIEEQTQIVQEIETRLSVCDNAIANIAEGLQKAEALRQSILKKAFAGKLLTDAELQACRQEPDWEPAAKLLERIKQDKKSTPRKKSTT